MRSHWTAAAAACVGMALTPLAASASDVEAQLRQMQERLQRVEDQLQATHDQLEAANELVEQQQHVIEQADLGSTRAASSGAASFLETLNVGGWVSGSYWFNLNDPDNNDIAGANTGRFGTSNPFNPDANSFSLDQLWFELERPVDDKHRAGFRADMLWGKTGGIFSGLDNRTAGRSTGSRAGADSDFYLYQAYIQYLAPIGTGVTFKAGKLATMMGGEVVQAPYNFNISRGLVYNLLQPIDQVGVVATANVAEGVEASLGMVNSFLPFDPDNNNSKTYLARLGFSQQGFGFAVTGQWGAETTANEDPKTGLIDVLLTLDPSDDLSLWANGDVLILDLPGGNDRYAWGLALAGRLALTDRTGIAVRGEYVEDDGGIFTGIAPAGMKSADANFYSLTGTIDHKLAEQLTLKGEVRWDVGNVDTIPDALFVSDKGNAPFGNFVEDDQVLIGAELIYTFN